MILSVAGLSSTRREVGVFHHLITVIFCLVIPRIMFVM